MQPLSNPLHLMRVAWVNPGFLDYRVPVYAELDALTAGGLHVIYSLRRTPQRVSDKLKARLRARAVGLAGEAQLNLGGRPESFANRGLNLPYQPGLYTAIRRVRPEVVIAEGFFQWTPAAVAYKLRSGVPLVIAYEKTAHTERNAGILRLLYRRWIARRADAIACNGRLSKEFCTQSLGISELRIVTGAMAADTESLQAGCGEATRPAREALAEKLRVASPAFLFVGRLIRLKGVRELIAAWKVYVAGLGGSGTLLIVGDGPERKTLEDLARGVPRIVFCGAIEYEQAVLYYGLCDVFVMPSLEDNWSLVVPEAMACGKPVLCSIYNGCWPELIQESKNGWTFDPTDAIHLARLLRRCKDQQDELRAMGSTSREIVAQFTPRAAASAVYRACQIALNGPGPVREGAG